MTTLKIVITRHPLLSYSALVFAISWGGILVVVGRGESSANGEQFERMFLFMYLAMLAGPAIAGILLTGLVHGRTGLRDFAYRLLKWRVGARWYAVALVTAPLAITMVLLALLQVSPDFLHRLYTSEDKAFLVQFSVIAGLLVGIFEELGWTGFAVNEMLRRGNNVLRTGLVVGILFAAWDFLVVFWMTDATSTAGALPLIIFLPVTLFTWLPTYRVLMVWVYDRTQSLFVAILMHTSLVAAWTMLTPLAITGMPLVTYYLAVTAAFWVVIAAIAATNGWHLSRQPLRGQAD
ncbi:MAG: CPBP family intramembrane metalloprotease [Chloroflexota bacterium]|nr:MAG: CPBP family intramembrane metalloprotease [Chloroflexota bacterium]